MSGSQQMCNKMQLLLLVTIIDWVTEWDPQKKLNKKNQNFYI